MEPKKPDEPAFRLMFHVRKEITGSKNADGKEGPDGVAGFFYSWHKILAKYVHRNISIDLTKEPHDLPKFPKLKAIHSLYHSAPSDKIYPQFPTNDYMLEAFEITNHFFVEGRTDKTRLHNVCTGIDRDVERLEPYLEALGVSRGRRIWLMDIPQFMSAFLVAHRFARVIDAMTDENGNVKNHISNDILKIRDKVIVPYMESEKRSHHAPHHVPDSKEHAHGHEHAKETHHTHNHETAEPLRPLVLPSRLHLKQLVDAV